MHHQFDPGYTNIKVGMQRRGKKQNKKQKRKTTRK
jgi:hypothetical protein